jgi:hypothetical protein
MIAKMSKRLAGALGRMPHATFIPKPAQNMLGAHRFARLAPNGFSAIFSRKTALVLSISAIFGGNRLDKARRKRRVNAPNSCWNWSIQMNRIQKQKIELALQKARIFDVDTARTEHRIRGGA